MISKENGAISPTSNFVNEREFYMLEDLDGVVVIALNFDEEISGYA